MGDTYSRDVEMLGAVAEAAAGSHTRQVLLRRLEESLARYFPLRRLEFNESVPNGESDESSIVIPLRIQGQVSGHMRMSLRQQPGAGPPSVDVLETLGRILAFALHHCHLVERIAKVSSAAHHDTMELRQELRKHSELDDIVARSQAMQHVLENVELVAEHDSTVLLRGESGTGKELLARRIHRLSKRVHQPYVAVNCGAIPDAIVDSELFGHEKGAFTGATGRHIGRFERAHHGTIFLDEIAELPLSTQVRLLRVLQDGTFERVGGETTIHVDVRVLAATHRPLEAMIKAGTFRSDLFYRINVFPIVIQPLRERKEDIPALAQTLVQQAAARLGLRAPVLGPNGVNRLLSHAWHGNVRELANTIERAVIVAKGKELEFRDLPIETDSSSGRSHSEETFDDAARRAIGSALSASGGRIYGTDGAAARLGIAPSTLQGKMRKLRIDRRATGKKGRVR